MTTWFNDTFTGASAGTALSAHTPDTGGSYSQQFPATAYPLTFVSGPMLGPSGDGSAMWMSSAVSPGADMTVSAPFYVNNLSSNFMMAGVGCRLTGSQGTANGYILLYYAGSTNAWKLCRATSSTPVLATPSLPAPSVGATMNVSLTATGSGSSVTLTMTVNGTTVTYTDSDTARATAAGAAGLYFFSHAAGVGMLATSLASTYTAPAAAAVTITGASSGATGVATTLTIGTDNPLTSGQTESVSLSDGASGTFSPNPVALSSTTTSATTSYTPAGSAGSRTITGTATGTPTLTAGTKSFTVTNPATAVTLTGPTSGTVSTASSAFTVGANGSITGTVTVTPSDGGAGGSFSPTTVGISAGSPTGTFTYTPTSTGARTISVTNNGGLTNPATIAYTSASAGTPTAGTASLSAATNTTITVTCSAASGGNAPLTYQWHRSTTAGFTPGAGTVLSGATSLTYADSASLAADTPYFYVCRCTDNTGQTADSLQIAGILRAAPLVLGFVGDSITYGYGLSAGQDPCTQVGTILAKACKSRAVTVVNRGISGTTTSVWTSGSSNLVAAKAAFAAAGCSHIHYALGVNDAVVPTTAAQYKANVQSAVNDLVAAGYKVILSYPTYVPAGTSYTNAAAVALLRSYLPQLDSLIDGVNVLRGDILAPAYFMDNLSELQSDQIHPNAAGALSLATMWARAIDRSVLQVSIGSGSGGTYPTAGQVLTGITYGPTGTDYTGTLRNPALDVFPTAAQVLSGVTFGPTGNMTGSLVSGAGGVFPTANKVLTGTAYGPTGADYTGALDVNATIMSLDPADMAELKAAMLVAAML